MLISIVIPTLNEEASITFTINALARLEGEKEIIVVDGGSHDRTVDRARKCGATVLIAPRGRGHQLRNGAAASRGSVLWFVHADTQPPAGALAAISHALSSEPVVGGNFGLCFDGETAAARYMTRIYPGLRLLNLCYGDSGIFIRRDVYERIGGFRPIALFEDLDLLKRTRRAGRFVHLPLCMHTSSRRFEKRNFAGMWIQWTTLQLLYWCGVSPDRLARYYAHTRKPAALTDGG